MSNNPLALVFDVGTQSARAMLIDKTGNIVAKCQKVYERPYFSKQPDWAEQTPEVYWDAICETSNGLKAQNEALWGDVASVSCTSIRDTCLCLDANGQPVRDVILWLDKREAEELENIPFVNSMMFRLAQIGEVTELIRRVSACNWIIKHEPDVWAKTDKFVFLSAYFYMRFTGRLADSAANIIGHVPFDVKTRTWCKKNDPKRVLFDVEDEKLCELVEPGTVVGNITAEAASASGIPAGLPFIATGSDKGCETLGLSCLHEDSAALSFGTTATVQITTDNYFEALPFVPPYPAVVGRYNPEVEIFRGYWLISWFKKEFATKEVAQAEAMGVSAEELLNERLKEIPAGCEGLMLQPYFTPGATMPHAKGAVIGFSDVHTRIHLYRAIIEGINFSLMEGLDMIEKRGKLKVKKLFLAGGGSRSAEICQITANMFGLPVYRIQTHEAAGIGSALVAFTSTGEFASYDAAAAAMIRMQDEFLPDMAEHTVYRKLYEKVFLKLFDYLSPLYRDINEILRAGG